MTGKCGEEGKGEGRGGGIDKGKGEELQFPVTALVTQYLPFPSQSFR